MKRRKKKKERLTTIRKKVSENAPVEGDQAERLVRIKAIISTVDWGRELLALADRWGFTITLRDDLKADQLGNLDHQDKTIDIRAQLNDADIMMALIHELRHMWQGRMWGITSESKVAIWGVDTLLFKRIVEGDARAFEIGFIERFRRQNEDMEAFLQSLEFQYVPEESMSMSSAFWRFQSAVSRQTYDGDTIALLTAGQATYDKSAPEEQAELTRIFNAAKKPLKDVFNLMLVNGLAATDPKYIDFDSVDTLTDAIRQHVPADILQQCDTAIARMGLKKQPVMTRAAR